MGTIRKRGNKYRAEIYKNGTRKSATFRTKSEAVAWSVDEERKIENEKKGISPDILFSDVIDRYQAEVSVHKKGFRAEYMRLNRFLRSPICDKYIKDVTKEDFESWRDFRLTQIASASVRRELATISAVLKQAVKWKYIAENPLLEVEKPENSKARSQRYADEDIKAILDVAGYDDNEEITTVTQRVAIAMLFAIETAMRAGEICALTWDNVSFEKRIAHLPTTKNGYSRDVPLSKEAIRLLKRLEEVKTNDLVFNMKADVLSSTFRKLKKKVNRDYLHFHDTRREALTRLSKKVDVMMLAKISGHRDLKILQNTYYAPNMSDIADLLD